jgi:uncharacterized protein GlcG (DUF336 family)
MTQLTLAGSDDHHAALEHAGEVAGADGCGRADARGVLKAYAAEDGTALRRADIAIGKAHGALSMGVGSRTLGKRAEERPHFIAAVTQAVGGSLIPVPGGVLIRGYDRSIIGAVGVTGDSSENDEAAVGWSGRGGQPPIRPDCLMRARSMRPARSYDDRLFQPRRYWDQCGTLDRTLSVISAVKHAGFEFFLDLTRYVRRITLRSQLVPRLGYLRSAKP